MNDEIKEILDAWKNKKYILAYTFNYDSAREQNDKLIDYITNLQQENERLKIDNKILKQNNINEVLRNDFDMCVKDLKKANKKIEKLEDYKSRIEKAVEYIKKHKTTITQQQADFYNRDELRNGKLKVGTFMWNVDELEDILNGRSDKDEYR